MPDCLVGQDQPSAAEEDADLIFTLALRPFAVASCAKNLANAALVRRALDELFHDLYSIHFSTFPGLTGILIDCIECCEDC